MESKDPIETLRFSLLEPIALPSINPSSQSIAELSLALKPLIPIYDQQKSKGEVDPKLAKQIDTILTQLKEKRLYEFILAVNQDIETFNALIEQYNQIDDINAKTDLLDQIRSKAAALDARFPESVIRSCPEYRTQFYDRLSGELQQNTERLTQLGASISAPQYRYRLSEFLQKMPQATLNRFLTIMCDRINYDDELEELYTKDDPEYEEFMAFISTHSIVFTGGHNSNNFEVQRLKSNEPPYLLKIENRINQPKEIAQQLQASVDNIVKPECSRRAYFERTERGGKKTMMVRSILTQDYYPDGSLYDYAQTQIRPQEKIGTAISVYANMAKVLQKISRAGGAFPDMKNSNWLIHNGQLLIADDKSFRRQNPDGSLDIFSDQSQWYGDILKSPSHTPPEARTTDPIQVEPMHVFTWGKNFYEYLIANEYDNSYYTLMEGKEFNFDYLPFKVQPEGTLLQQLIVDTVREKPEDRREMTMDVILTRLEHIELIRSLRAKIPGILNPPLPYPVLTQYMEMVLNKDKSDLEEFAKSLGPETLRADLEPFIEKYRSDYQRKFAETFQKIDSILKEHPNDDLREALLAVKMEHQSLELFNFDQFEVDLNELLKAAEQIAAEQSSKPNLG
ncbi:MAG: hypothetical protein NXI01_01025 [Gammaproteobacteria bacterium]|nr:hypothetical protein [Gammaproteobacteria bacterium]